MGSSTLWYCDLLNLGVYSFHEYKDLFKVAAFIYSFLSREPLYQIVGFFSSMNFKFQF